MLQRVRQYFTWCLEYQMVSSLFGVLHGGTFSRKSLSVYREMFSPFAAYPPAPSQSHRHLAGVHSVVARYPREASAQQVLWKWVAIPIIQSSICLTLTKGWSVCLVKAPASNHSMGLRKVQSRFLSIIRGKR